MPGLLEDIFREAVSTTPSSFIGGGRECILMQLSLVRVAQSVPLPQESVVDTIPHFTQFRFSVLFKFWEWISWTYPELSKETST